MPTPLLIVGAGGFARETAEAVRACNDVTPVWDLLGFLDDDPRLAGAVVGGLPVLGPIDLIYQRPDAELVVCTGRPDNYVSRPRLVARLGLTDDRYATVVHPTAAVATTAQLGVGSVLLAQVALTADVTVGRHVAVMPQCVLTHDVRVDDFATLASGVRLGGGVHVAEGAYLGSGAGVREGRTIGVRAMVGMGAQVTGDVPAERLWFGVPARDRGPAPLPAPVPGTVLGIVP